MLSKASKFALFGEERSAELDLPLAALSAAISLGCSLRKETTGIFRRGSSSASGKVWPFVPGESPRCSTQR